MMKESTRRGFVTLNADLVSSIDRMGSLITGLPFALSKLASAKLLCRTKYGIQFEWAIQRDNLPVFQEIVDMVIQNQLLPPRISAESFAFDDEGINAAYNSRLTGKAVLQF
eukprot:TRINITY_DN11346_c0_g2_i1.p1 TRINITY_DN11346_c0_g2~~TRINITY_DN11346_c0_g2_i1.p1  ORF type:complete len:111 (+),score=32.53 TRINITY_DN11346_c0_g2_i1:208-540(+)